MTDALTRLANPQRFANFADGRCHGSRPRRFWSCSSASTAPGSWRRPTTSRARRSASSTCMCRRLDGDVRLDVDVPLGHRDARLPPSHGRRGAEGGRAHRCGLLRRMPDHRLALGAADVGHLLGLGRAADLDAGAAADVFRRDGAVARHRGPGHGRARRRHRHARRRDQPADHQVLGRLVEHAAPAGVRAPPRRADDPQLDALAAAGDGAWRGTAVCHAHGGAHAHGTDGAPAATPLARAAHEAA